MGEVYLAEDSRLHRKVALKILLSEMAANQDRMRRFRQRRRQHSILQTSRTSVWPLSMPRSAKKTKPLCGSKGTLPNARPPVIFGQSCF
jgi:hypothetical protein